MPSQIIVSEAIKKLVGWDVVGGVFITLFLGVGWGVWDKWFALARAMFWLAACFALAFIAMNVVWLVAESLRLRIFLSLTGIMVTISFLTLLLGVVNRNEERTFITVHYKESVALTPRRKARIRKELSHFTDYLSEIGFQVPRETPLIGTIHGTAMGQSIEFPGDMTNAALFLPEATIDDVHRIVSSYATFYFRQQFHGERFWDSQSKYSSDMSAIYAEYFPADFEGEYRTRGPDNHWAHENWVNAFWDLRKRIGSDFVDQALYFALVKGPEPLSDDNDFDRYFRGRFLAGVFFEDNSQGHEALIKDVLGSWGL